IRTFVPIMKENKSIKAISKYATPIKSLMRAGTDDETGQEHKAWEAAFDDHGHIIEEIKYFENGLIEERHLFEYDKSGNIILHKIEIPGEGIEESFITERDANGNPVKITKMYAEDPGEITQYIYAEHGKPLQIDQYD